MIEPNTRESWYSFIVPSPIETARLLLRAYEPADAPRLKTALDANLEHLQRWMPWAMEEPSPLEAIEERLARFAMNFLTGPDWGFAIFIRDQPALIGSTGLHARIGPRALEIGYWIDARLTRRGYATEAAAAMTRLGFSFPEIDRLEIRCDPHNVASAGVPRRLGYRHISTIEKQTTTPTGEPRDTMVWQMTRDEFSAAAFEASFG